MHREAEPSTRRSPTGQRIIAESLAALAEAGAGGPAAGGAGGPAAGAAGGPAEEREPLLLNTAPVPRRGVAAYGVGRPAPVQEAVVVTRAGGAVTLENEMLRAELDETGALVSLIARADGREHRPEPAARSPVDRDTPNAWDAWDIESSTVTNMTEVGGGGGVRCLLDRASWWRPATASPVRAPRSKTFVRAPPASTSTRLAKQEALKLPSPMCVPHGQRDPVRAWTAIPVNTSWASPAETCAQSPSRASTGSRRTTRP